MSVRIAQVIAKILNLGIAAIAGHFGTQFAAGQIDSISEPIAAGIATAILLVADIYMHKFTGSKTEQK